MALSLIGGVVRADRLGQADTTGVVGEVRIVEVRVLARAELLARFARDDHAIVLIHELGVTGVR